MPCPNQPSMTTWDIFRIGNPFCLLLSPDAADRTSIGRFMRRLLVAGFTSAADADIDASISSDELKLLNRVQSDELHVLRSLFPP